MSYDSSSVLHTAYIALGSNLGDRVQNLHAALAQIKTVSVLSSFLENPAVGGPADSPPFINAVAQIETDLDPRALLEQLLNIEQKLGRRRDEKWGPRSIDLDILLYENQIIQTRGLVVPHPLMHKRKFVLQPLAQIAPNIIHPVFKQTINQLLAELLAEDP